MSFLFTDFLKYYMDHAGKSGAKLIRTGSLTNPLTVASLPTRIEQVSGIFVQYIDYICASACVESYKDPKNRKQALDWQFTYDSETSTERTAIYVGRGLTKTVVISIRGTHDLLDIATDILVVAGAMSLSPRLNAQIQFVNGLVRDYIDGGTDIDNIYLCGHSLGALIGLHVHYGYTETEFIGFNPGFPPNARLPHEKGLSMQLKIHKMLESPNVTMYIMKGDPIASIASGLLKNEIIITPNPPAIDGTQAHSMDFMLKNMKLHLPLSFDNPFSGFLSGAMRL